MISNFHGQRAHKNREIFVESVMLFGTCIKPSCLLGNSLLCHTLATVPIMQKINEARYFIHTAVHLRVYVLT